CEIYEKTFHRFWNLLERQAAAPRAKLRTRPIDLGWAQVSRVELVHEQHVQILLLNRPRLCGRARGGKRHRLTIALHFARAQVKVMQLHPLRGYPVLVLEYAKLGVSTVKMHEPHEKQWQHCTPARIVCLRDGGL